MLTMKPSIQIIFLVCLGFALPAPAAAFRAETPEEASGLEELAGALQVTPSPSPAGGMEEQGIQTLLIVEDTPSIRERIVQIVQAWRPGINLLVAEDLARAFELLYGHWGKIDAILVDYSLISRDKKDHRVSKELMERVQELRGGSLPMALFTDMIPLLKEEGWLAEAVADVDHPLVDYRQKPLSLDNYDRPVLELLETLDQAVAGGLEESATDPAQTMPADAQMREVLHALEQRDSSALETFRGWIEIPSAEMPRLPSTLATEAIHQQLAAMAQMDGMLNQAELAFARAERLLDLADQEGIRLSEMEWVQQAVRQAWQRPYGSLGMGTMRIFENAIITNLAALRSPPAVGGTFVDAKMAAGTIPHRKALQAKKEALDQRVFQLFDRFGLASPLTPPQAVGDQAVPAGQEEPQVVMPEAFDEESPALAARMRADGVARALLIPLQVPGEGLSPSAITLYAQPSVMPAALGLLPDGAAVRDLVPIPVDDPAGANQRLEEAAAGLEEGAKAIIALAPGALAALRLPERHPMVWLLNPDTWHKISRGALTSLLHHANKLANFILDLSRGTIYRAKLRGREYLAIYLYL